MSCNESLSQYPYKRDRAGGIRQDVMQVPVVVVVAVLFIVNVNVPVRYGMVAIYGLSLFRRR
jgi:hypothetical protein